MTLTKLVVDCSTGITSEVEFTPEETIEYEIRQAEYNEWRRHQEVEEQAKEEAKASALAKLEALGLTAEEANALIS
jgi:hypothetical protein